MSEETNGNGAPSAETQEMIAEWGKIRALETSVLLARARFAAQSGLTFNGVRDEYTILGYDPIIQVQQYIDEYCRGGVAGAIVDVMPNATWRGQPAFELVEDEDPENKTEFEKAWDALEQRLQIGSKLLRTDKLSRLSTYAVLIIGDGTSLEEPLKKVKSPEALKYLRPVLGAGGPNSSNYSRTATDFSASATIFEYDVDPKSERFGLPLSYQIRDLNIATPVLARPVHWSRVVHVAEGLLLDDVFGLPALERVWNLLIDLRKVTGGGAEAFWLRANQGLHLDIDKDMALADVAGTVEALKAQAEEYKHQMTRWMRTRGVKVETLGSDVANFDNPADAVLTQIAGATGIPKRILTGSEMGELASSQDRENFRDKIIGRQLQYAGPYIVRQLVDRLIQFGFLPEPKGGPDDYQVKWPHIEVLTETEKVAGAQGMASTNSTFGDTVFTDSEIRDNWFGWAPLTDEQRKEIDERSEEKMKRQQEMMAAQKPPPEDAPSAEKLRAAQEGQGYKFSSTQVQLPPVLADMLLTFGKSIPAFDLCEEEGGLEDDAHITVKYGLHTNDVSDVRKALATYVGPIRFTLGKTNFFRGSAYDVLYVEVNSPDLIALNQRISDRLEVTDTHPVYTPHVTVAYLKLGLAERYRGLTNFEGMSATVGTVRFSPVEGDDVDLRVTGRAETGQFAIASPIQEPPVIPAPELIAAEAHEDLELLRVLTTAIECGATDVVDRIIGLKRA